jgi:nucleoside-diphosphate-sugar epimerase
MQEPDTYLMILEEGQQKATRENILIVGEERLGPPEEAALSRKVYNVGSFDPSAGEVYEHVRRAFPDARVTFEPDAKRQGIVDSWPVTVDDAAARADWGWEPGYDLDRAFDEYLLPVVARRYRQPQKR